MTLLKNVRAHSIDVGGRMLPTGEAADLDVTAEVVSEAVESGHLVPVQKAKTRRQTEES